VTSVRPLGYGGRGQARQFGAACSRRRQSTRSPRSARLFRPGTPAAERGGSEAAGDVSRRCQRSSVCRCSAAAALEIVRLLKSAAIWISRVVDVGCSAGPLTSALVEAGLDVTGIDSSTELVSYARTAAPSARFVNAFLTLARSPKY